MKIRRGFVSNSSTTSFCIYGARTKVDEDNYEGDLWKETQELGINYEYGQCDDYYLGAAWRSIKDDETGAEFKERVKAAVKQIDPDVTEFDTYEEAYRDG